MKAMFSHSTDSVEEVIHFVEHCYERGLDITVETSGTAKRRRRRAQPKPVKEEADEDDDSGFTEDLNKVAAQANGSAEGVDPVKKPARKRRRRAGRTAKKRSPDITRDMYNRIKDGDPTVNDLYAPHTINVVRRSKNWNAYTAFKASQAQKARERHALSK